MRPILFEIYGVPFFAYRTLLAVAFVVCTLLTVRASRTRPGGIEVSPMLGIWAMFGSLAGAHGFFIAQYGDIRELWRALFVWEGGLVFYGGLFGGLAATAIYLKLCKVPFLNAADSAAPYLATGEAIARVGCFLNGCCWGAVCNWPWAISFPPDSPAFAQHIADHGLARSAADSLPVHPTQLYMVIGLAVICGVLHRALFRERPAGLVFFSYVFLYGMLRFLVELVRGDSARSVLGLTVSGAISAAFVALGIAACAFIVRNPRSLSE